MSLFKTREWWGSNPESQGEIYSDETLVVSTGFKDVVNGSTSSVIVTGSLAGTVRYGHEFFVIFGYSGGVSLEVLAFLYQQSII